MSDDERCINGIRYKYENIPRFVTPQGEVTPEVGYSPSASDLNTEEYQLSLLERVANATEAIAIELAKVNAWRGSYRHLQIVVPAMEVNFSINWGWPARVFVLNSTYSLSIKLINANQDEFETSGSSPEIKMTDIHHSLAFSEIYVSNLSAVDAKVDIVVFG